ncbi:Dual specificity protein phosphatase 10-like [Homarus americanus]|uniref:protein-tyrosine-phosphatase n=1 Tax=Homarus americanus TaxID=6706 RepID=A0A8J5JXH0_HOMAM|nr:Dual specificity protein phosphatase 10-like [Homarus americanus]
MNEARQAGARVLVHCQAGVSRSPTIVIAYLMKHTRMTMVDSYKYVKSRRLIISPNLNFMGQLVEWETALQDNKTEADCKPCHQCQWQRQEVKKTPTGLSCEDMAPDVGLGSFSMGTTEAVAVSSRKVLECGCWRQKQDTLHTALQEDAADHLTTLGQHLHSHHLTRLFLDDLEVKLNEEVQRREATEKDITIHRNIHSANVSFDTEDDKHKSSKRSHCRGGDLGGVRDAEDANTAKRMCTEQILCQCAWRGDGKKDSLKN